MHELGDTKERNEGIVCRLILAYGVCAMEVTLVHYVDLDVGPEFDWLGLDEMSAIDFESQLSRQFLERKGLSSLTEVRALVANLTIDERDYSLTSGRQYLRSSCSSGQYQSG